MKKTTKDQEKNRKSRRPSLKRETIRGLNDPELLELARGGTDVFTDSGVKCCATGSHSNPGG